LNGFDLHTSTGIETAIVAHLETRPPKLLRRIRGRPLNRRRLTGAGVDPDHAALDDTLRCRPTSFEPIEALIPLKRLLQQGPRLIIAPYFDVIDARPTAVANVEQVWVRLVVFESQPALLASLFQIFCSSGHNSPNPTLYSVNFTRYHHYPEILAILLCFVPVDLHIYPGL
jgi:hypothetical protein